MSVRWSSIPNLPSPRRSFPGSRAGFTVPMIRRQPRREKARSLAERAIQLQPDCAEGHLALGFSYYYGDRDYENALKEFAIAQRGLPNDAEVYLAIGAIQRRQGKWKESNANLEKAASLEPERDVAPAKSGVQL